MIDVPIELIKIDVVKEKKIHAALQNLNTIFQDIEKLNKLPKEISDEEKKILSQLVTIQTQKFIKQFEGLVEEPHFAVRGVRDFRMLMPLLTGLNNQWALVKEEIKKNKCIVHREKVQLLVDELYKFCDSVTLTLIVLK